MPIPLVYLSVMVMVQVQDGDFSVQVVRILVDVFFAYESVVSYRMDHYLVH